MRWRGWFGGFVPRLLPHSLSSLVLFLLRRLPLPAFVEPLILFLLRRLSLRALIPPGCGAQGLGLLSLQGSLVGLCLPPLVCRIFWASSFETISHSLWPLTLVLLRRLPLLYGSPRVPRGLPLGFEPNAPAHRERPTRDRSR